MRTRSSFRQMSFCENFGSGARRLMSDDPSPSGSSSAIEEVRRLRAHLRDLIAISAFPAAWVGREPSDIVTGTLDVLRNTLRLDLAYACVDDPAGASAIEAALDGEGVANADRVRAISSVLAPSLRHDLNSAPAIVPDLLGNGKLRLAIAPIGVLSEGSLIVAGSRREDFPTDPERLLVSLIANQAAIALQHAGLLATQRRAEEALREEARIIETLHRVGGAVAAELDLQTVVRVVTDAATELSGAQFGSFFYNEVNEHGESYMLYTLSGVPQEAFERFPLPRNTDVFGPTFRGEGIVRLDDVTRDPRYGKRAPYHGMPPGHLPVRSYLAVPVVSRSGEVLGGLFFGHSVPGMFTERAERLVAGIASQAAIAMDNARLYTEAREAANAREQFLSIASHELKTPLTTVKGSIQLLVRRLRQIGFNDERILRLISQVESGSERMEILVSDLLDAARIQQGRLDLRTERVDLAELTRQVVQRFEDAPERNLQHTLALDAPNAVEGLWDPAMLDQMLTNLVSNGLKYSPAGGEVLIRVRGFDAHAEVTVRDQGIGIPPDELEMVFQPFVRGAAVHQSIGGTGLGLYITAQIIERHGGAITVESTSGKGSIFSVRLPLSRTDKTSDAGLV